MQMVTTTRGVPGVTFTMTSTNASQALTAASILGSGGNNPIGALITCETNNVKYVFGGATPVFAALGHILVKDIAAGQLWLDSGEAVQSFRFVSAAENSHGVLQITPFFEFGKA